MKRKKKQILRPWKNKWDWEVLHVQEGLLNRYGIAMTIDQIRGLGRKIRKGKSIFIKRETCTRTSHLVEHNGEYIAVVYDQTRSIPVTVLPKEVRDAWERKSNPLFSKQ